MCVYEYIEEVVELNFLEKQPVRSLCVCHSRRWISAVSLRGAEGQPLFIQEKGVFWVEPQSEACQIIITAKVSHANNTPAGRASHLAYPSPVYS